MEETAAREVTTIILASMFSFILGYRIGKNAWQSDKAKTLELKDKRK